ncbi:MAG: glycoside hydrolase family 65, partial [Burkholderiales bacterium]|nr:glycoside hydrolase family 65 [Phycisphaerae bacterium]
MIDSPTAPIDRQKVVQRHNVVMRVLDPRSPLTVGNGEFAFGVDPTGLQSFPEPYVTAMPLCTMSNWGWHSKPLPAGLDPATIRYTNFDTYGRPVGHVTSSEGQKPLFDWLRENPHRFHLGRIGIEITLNNGQLWTIDDLRDVKQTLDVWTGIITSRFAVEGTTVEVTTCCAGERDALGIQVRSDLLKQGRLKIVVRFPYGSQDMSAAEWGKDDLHSTTLSHIDNGVVLIRSMDDISYGVILQADQPIDCIARTQHELAINPRAADHLAFTADFAIKPNPTPILFEQAITASKTFWHDFWTSGGAIDFEGSTDPRAHELERRVVLSQYVMRINSAG